MIFGVRRLEPKEWGELTAKAHLVAFGENRDPELERIDFALLATSLCDDAFGYVTCIEMDKETLYWQRGGSFPNAKGTVLSLQGTRALASYCGQFYKRITARVEHKNITAIKMALKIGFLIMGTYTYKNKIYVEFCLELEGRDA